MAASRRFSCLNLILHYLDKKDVFEKIRVQCETHNNEQLVYIFPIDVNLHDLFEISEFLGDKILTAPDESSNLFHEVIFEFIKCQNLLPASVSSSQVLAKLSIVDLPGRSFQIFNTSDLIKHCCYQGLVKLTGFVIGMTGRAKYTQSARYVCPDNSCEGHYGNHFVRIHIPGASEKEIVRSDFPCAFCGSILKEAMSSRTLSDKIIAEIIPIKLEGDQRKEMIGSNVMQALPAIIRDNLIPLVELGKSYVFIGVCCTSYVDDEITVTLEVNSIKEISDPSISETNAVECLSDAVASLYHECKPHKWRFVFQMAFHFAGSVVPPGKIFKLRLFLLISLVLSAEKHKLHILAVGNEMGPASDVIRFAQQFSKRSSSASVDTPLNGKVTNSKYSPALYFIQAGSFLLSSGGIYCAGEISMWKKARVDELKAAVNSNKVMIELASKYTGGLPQTVSLPLPCQVLAVYDTSGCKHKTNCADSDIFIGCSTGDLSKTFIDSFSIVAFLNGGLSSYDEERELLELDFIMKTHCDDLQETESLIVDKTDFEKYLSVAKRLDPMVSVEAEMLLHSYNTASRMARSTGCGSSGIPPTSLSSLISLSVGIAKLQLRDVVTEHDASLGIYLYEEYITSRCGMSLLNIKPCSDLPPCEADFFLGPQSDMMMDQFCNHLQQFCSRVQDSTRFNLSMNTAFKEE